MYSFSSIYHIYYVNSIVNNVHRTRTSDNMGALLQLKVIALSCAFLGTSSVLYVSLIICCVGLPNATDTTGTNLLTSVSIHSPFERQGVDI